MSIRLENGWYIDENNNRWDAGWVTQEEAEQLSKTLIDCNNCTNCKNCKNCEDCADCVDCSFCFRCKACNDCRMCEYCANCKSCEFCLSVNNSSYVNYSYMCSHIDTAKLQFAIRNTDGTPAPYPKEKQ